MDPSNHAVISGENIPNLLLTKAADMIITNGFPYWQGTAIERGNTTFYQSYLATKNAVNGVSQGKPIWVGETGWPTGYANYTL